jgi:hypothetical protein
VLVGPFGIMPGKGAAAQGPQWTSSTHAVHHEGWMISDQETIFGWVPVP